VGTWRSIDDKTGRAQGRNRHRDHGGVLSGHIEKRAAPRTPSPTRCATNAPTTARASPWMGLEIIRGARKADGKDVWEGGKILDPENGKQLHPAPHPHRGRQEARSARLHRPLRPHPDLGARPVNQQEEDMSRFQVKKVAVLGAGVMGAQIAAHLVNVKVPVVLFDLPAKEGPKNGIVTRPSKA
jgi:hypothetical protein